MFRDSLELVRGPRRRGGLGGVKNKNRETKAFGNREFEGNRGTKAARAGACSMEHPSFIGAVA